MATTTVTSLTAGVTVPTLSCAGVGAAGPVSVAVQVAESGPAGRGALFDLDFTCDAGTASYGGYFGSPNGVHFSLGFVPAAGDKIMVKMWAGQVAGWTWVKATDETQHLSGELESLVPHTTAQAGFLVQGPAPVPPFEKLLWHGVTVNGNPLGDLSPTSYELEAPGGIPLVMTSRLSANGLDFTNTFVGK